MQELEPGRRVVGFGSFEVDIQEGRLTKNGIPIKLQGQPFQILTLLLERPGQVVTREEIRQKLWSEDTFVEFDDGLNTAVRKLRTALGDPAENPRFVETVPRRGYRFVAPVRLPPEPELAKHRKAEVASEPGIVPSAIRQIEPTSFRTQPKRNKARLAGIVLAALLILAGVGTYLYLRRPTFHVSSNDTIVLADFVNTTGDAVFDDALKQGLEVGLQQSPFFNILSDRKTAVVLKQMGRSPDERMSGRVAIEVCQRTGGKATIQGSISSLGTAYLIGLAAIRCDNGDPVAFEQVEAHHKEDVVDAMGKATTHLRARLGESIPSIKKYNAPLELATTPSLEALQAYGVGLSTWDQKGDLASVPVFKRAIALDPNFAMAYGALATVCHNLGETKLARENATKAYELRDRVTESERVSIEARYHLYVTGDLEQAAQVYELWVQNYPAAAGGFNHLGTTYSSLGRNEKAVDAFRQALRIDPTRATTYSNLAVDLFALNRFDEARAVLADADKRNLQTDYLLQARYWEAFLRNDNAGMQALLLRASDIPGAQSLLLNEQANAEAYFGHLGRARELSRVAAAQLEHDGDKESAADYLSQAAVRESETGASAEAAEDISQAMKLDGGRDVTTLAALVMARTGDLQQAETISDQLDKDYPSDTFVQKYWLPVIRAEIELRQGKWSKAIETLNATATFEFAAPSAFPVGNIYPAYVRGQAYMAGGDAVKAGVEFQKLIDRSGLVLNSPLAALARLERARAFSLAKDSTHARDAYRNFLDLWKSADPELTLLKQAKAEYAKLQ